MTDITGGLDLLGDWLDAKGYTEEAGLCTKAMDEINRLKDKLNGMLHCSEAYDAMAKLCSETEWALNEKIEALRAENARLQAKSEFIYGALLEAKGEINRLREALKPFADVVDYYTATADDNYPIDYAEFTLGDLRAARKALEDK